MKLIFFFFSNKKKFQVYANLTMGALAGCMAVSVTYPTDLIRRRYQVSLLMDKNPTGLIDTWLNIIKNEGFLTLYRGLGATYLKIIPSTAILFASNE